MKKTLIAFAAVFGFGIAGLAATPAAAAPVAPTQLGLAYQEAAGGLVEEARHRRGHRGWHRHHARRHHFWAPGPWAFRGVPYQNCFRVTRGGYFCYF